MILITSINSNMSKNFIAVYYFFDKKQYTKVCGSPERIWTADPYIISVVL